MFLLLACSSDDAGDEASGSTTSSVGEAPSTADELLDPFCAPAEALGEGLGDVGSSQGGADEVREELTKARDALTVAQAEAPAEIEGDVAVLAAGFEAFFAELEAADFDFDKLSLEALAGLDSPEMEAAGQRLADYQARTCGNG